MMHRNIIFYTCYIIIIIYIQKPEFKFYLYTEKCFKNIERPRYTWENPLENKILRIFEYQV